MPTAARLLKKKQDGHVDQNNPWRVYSLAMDAVAAYSAVEVLALQGKPIEAAKWSTPFLRVLIQRVEQLDGYYRKLHTDDGRLLCRANGCQVVRYADGAGVDFLGLTIGLLRDRLGKIRRAICPDTEGTDECTAAWEPVTIEATYDCWPEVRKTLSESPKIQEHELKCEILAELHRVADLVDAKRSPSLRAEETSASKDQESSLVKLDLESLGGKDAALAVDPPKQPWQPRKPDKKAWIAHSLRAVRGITNQTDIAAEMTRGGIPIDQGTVSRKLRQVESYLAGGGSVPSADEFAKPDTVDPKLLDLGKRQDGRTPRQRNRRDDESDE
jgi:hypothetical protein